MLLKLLLKCIFIRETFKRSLNKLTVKPLVFYSVRWKPKSINYERLCIKRNYEAY